MKKFDWEDFIVNEIVVHCKTQEEIDNFKHSALLKCIKWLDVNEDKDEGYYIFDYIHYTKPYDIFLIGIKQEYKQYGDDEQGLIEEWSKYMN